MTRETLTWLDENTLIGFTEKRGKAWHYRQGSDNHCTGPIPVERVRERLFSWTAEERDIYTRIHNPRSDESAFTAIPGRKAIVRSDTGAVLGVHGDSYVPHQYNEWLINNVETILDDTLQIGSAGLLKGGAQAWVQVEVPETIETPQGVRFRPFLLASTSLDGSLSTQYSRAVTNVVCDNTMTIALAEHGGERFRVRHSSKSLLRITEARQAVGVVYSAADDFMKLVGNLTSIKFPLPQFDKLLDAQTPYPDKKKAAAAWSQCDEKRTFLRDLYRFDERVAPWTGTAFGAWQAFNTYRQHERRLRGEAIRAERNMTWNVTGQNGKIDRDVLGDILELTA